LINRNAATERPPSDGLSVSTGQFYFHAGVRISDALMKQIKDWVKTEGGATRSEAIRRLVGLGLKAKK
jgi:hypothetical protein